MRHRWPIALLLGVAATAAPAADAQGRFAIEGAGIATCGQFLAAAREGSRDVGLYAGWIEGYVTGLNQFTSDTFDLTPWQTAQSMLGLLESVCKDMTPETRVIDAFTRLLRILAPHRLREESPLDGVQAGGRGAVVYRAVVVALQGRLAALGLFGGAQDGLFGADTAAALAAFQRREGLEPTGLPDQPTLFALLLKQR